MLYGANDTLGYDIEKHVRWIVAEPLISMIGYRDEYMSSIVASHDRRSTVVGLY